MKSILKYPGGKEKELKFILPNLPKEINNYYEPFVGGGAVYFAMPTQKKYYINDKSEELILFYNMIKNQNQDFLRLLNSYNSTWGKISRYVEKEKEILLDLFLKNEDEFREGLNKYLANKSILSLFKKEFNPDNKTIKKYLKQSLNNKYKTIKKIEAENKQLSGENDIFNNICCSFKTVYYMVLRDAYNEPKERTDEERASLYFFIREYCYSSMFRFNSEGKFNVPYGGISYNEKYLTNKIKFMGQNDYIERFKKTIINGLDFYDFMKQNKPKKNDFIFLDPPYDTEFSTYDQNVFDKNDQKRLADYLIGECKGNFMLIIKNTDYIASLYPVDKICSNGNKIKVRTFDKHYLVSFKNRNDKDCQHLLITNY
jgi:DNA adenine methylase